MSDFFVFFLEVHNLQNEVIEDYEKVMNALSDYTSVISL